MAKERSCKKLKSICEGNDLTQRPYFLSITAAVLKEETGKTDRGLGERANHFSIHTTQEDEADGYGQS